MFVGLSLFTMQTTLILHASLVPIIFGAISFIYHRNFAYTKPPVTALIFMAFPIIMDTAIIAPFIEKSYEMFHSFLGTWLPFMLIFLSTWTVGAYIIKHR
jgi:hypothetical protein